ncbi:MAG: hypothetical protein CME06_04145 [Gemmatimonadetes bacterium]|nr:hypothetical protein [Gemmatimonadota bacterium]
MQEQILHVASSAPRRVGDWTSPFVLDEARALQGAGFPCRIICPAPAEAADLLETIEGVPIERCRYLPPGAKPRLVYAKGGAAATIGSGRGRLEALPLLLTLARATSRSCVSRPTAAIVAHWSETGAAVWPIARRRRIPWALRVHRANPRGPMERLLFRAVVRAADLVLANSEYTLKRVERLGRARRSRIVPPIVAPELVREGAGESATDVPAQLGLPRGRPIVLGLGRLIEKKGHIYLLNAASELRAPSGRPLVVIAGEGPMEQRLRKHAAVRADFARLIGGVPRSLVPGLLRAASVVVQPSVVDAEGEAETYGVSVVEGMLAERPVVVTRTGALPERACEGAQVVPARDLRAISWAVNQLLGDPERAEAIGRKSARLARRHCIRAVDDLRESMEALIDGARGGAFDG